MRCIEASAGTVMGRDVARSGPDGEADAEDPGRLARLAGCAARPLDRQVEQGAVGAEGDAEAGGERLLRRLLAEGGEGQVAPAAAGAQRDRAAEDARAGDVGADADLGGIAGPELLAAEVGQRGPAVP